jgi:hypothetical protein
LVDIIYYGNPYEHAQTKQQHGMIWSVKKTLVFAIGTQVLQMICMGNCFFRCLISLEVAQKRSQLPIANPNLLDQFASPVTGDGGCPVVVKHPYVTNAWN